MSFSSRVKDDLARVLTSKACCRQGEFMAFFLIKGNIMVNEKQQISLNMTTEHTAAARKMFSLVKEYMPIRKIAVYRQSRLKKNQVVSINIPEQPEIDEFFRHAGIMEHQGRFRFKSPLFLKDTLLKASCCRRAYLRGAFLAGGSITDPEGSYHLEIGGLDRDQAELLVDILASFELKGRIVRRKGAEIVYLKEGEQISQFMNLVGSHRSMLEFESVRVTKEMRNNVNRQTNCDNANIDKTVAAAMRQVADIEYISRCIGLSVLPQNLRQVAELRLDNPEESLAGLAQISTLGRSALNHRFRRLTQIADNIRDFGPESWDRRD